MKRNSSYLILIFIALFVNGCSVSSRTKTAVPISYTSVRAYMGRHQYLTFNENDHQFYYFQDWVWEMSIIGSWNLCADTLYLHPALMYVYQRGDTLATAHVNVDDYDKWNYCPLKFLMRGKKGEILEDITDYSDKVQYSLWYKAYKDPSTTDKLRDFLKKTYGADSIIPVDYFKNDFILSLDFKKLKKKWGKCGRSKSAKKTKNEQSVLTDKYNSMTSL